MKILKLLMLGVILSCIISIQSYAVYYNIDEIQPTYNYISNAINGHVLATDDNDITHVINLNTGNTIISGKTIQFLGDNYICHIDYDNQQSWYTDYSGKTIFTLPNGICGSEYIGNYSLSRNWDNLKFGLIDLYGNIVLECEYDNIYIGLSDTAYLKKDGSIALVDLNTKESIPLSLNITKVLNSKKHILVRNSDRLIGIADFHGNVITEIKYSDIIETSDKYFIGVWKYPADINKHTVDIIDYDGNIINTIDGFIGDIHNGIFFIESLDGNSCGYMNINGNMNISLNDEYGFSNGSIFKDGYAAIKTFNKDSSGYTYIDETGSIATEKRWAYTYDFNNGHALVKDNIEDEQGNIIGEQWYLIDTDFNIVKTIEHDIVLVTSPYTTIRDQYSNNSMLKTRNFSTNKLGYIYIKPASSINSTAEKYSVHYNSGEANGDITGIFGVIPGNEIVVSTSSIYTYPGYTFSHWTDGTNIYYPGETFIMPDHDVTLTAVWIKDEEPSTPDTPQQPDTPSKPNKPSEPENDNTPSFPYFPWFPIIGEINGNTPNQSEEPEKYICPFDDIENHWGKQYIEFVHEYGLIDGITDTEFQPNEPMTREMFVIAMARLAGIDRNHVEWAIEKELLLGYGNGKYGLQDTVTREQMAAFFERFLNIMEVDINSLKQTKQKTFADDDTISDWAKESVYLMQKIKLIQGKENNLFDPLAKSTRAEAATVLYNLIQVIIDQK